MISLALTAALAQQPLLELLPPATVPQVPGSYGEFVAGIGDVDGDGHGDLAVTAAEGRVVVHSGADGAAISVITPPAPILSGIGALDVDGDGVLEVLVAYQYVLENSFWGVSAYGALDGAERWTYGDFTFAGGREIRLHAMADRSGDGIGEVAVGATENDPYHPADWQSSSFVLSGSDGTPLIRLRQWAEHMGEGVASISDLDGDGLAEFVVARPDHRVIFAPSFGTQGAIEAYGEQPPNFEGPTGFLWRTVGAGPGAELGEALAAVEDLDGGGVSDLVTVESIAPSGSSEATTLRVVVLRGEDGTRLVAHDFPGEAYPGEAHEVELASLGDLDGDGVSEVALITRRAEAWNGSTPALRILSGASLEVLQAWGRDVAPLDLADAEGVEVAAAGDVDGDGWPDVIVGAPHLGASGKAFVLPGRPSVGVRYCPSVANSTGRVAHVSLVGSREVTTDELRLVVSDLPPGAFTLPIASREAGVLPAANGSVGTLCLAGSIVRMTRYHGAADPAGLMAFRVELGTWASDFGVPPVAAGERWHFQAWHRDRVGGLATSNFSDARVTILR